MITCPNCGHENPETRAFCAVCGERLPQPMPTIVVLPAPTEEIAALPAKVPATEVSAELPHAEAGEKEVADIEWLLDQSERPAPTTIVAAPPNAAPPAPEPPPPVAPSEPANTFLPAWLQGLDLEPEPQRAGLPDADWADALDFSNLPDWAVDGDATSATATDPAPHPEPRRALAWSTETGGLLAGVQGLIPQQPAIRIPYAIPFPHEADPTPHDDGADLFARIAGGTVVPDAVVLPTPARRGPSILHLLLLLAVVVPLLLALVLGPNVAIFGAPAQLPSATAYGAAVEALPPESTVLLAFDYDGSLRDEVEPGAVATLNHLRTLTMDETATPRDLNLVAISLSPEGPALAERVWAASNGPPLAWTNLGFLPGGPVALRALLTQTETPLDEASLLVVFANEPTDVQRWLEQVGSRLPTLPILAVAPASAETTLRPYLASGQLDGLLAGTPGVASYEVSGAGTLGAGWRRIHALTAAALLTLGVILFVNLRAGERRRAS